MVDRRIYGPKPGPVLKLFAVSVGFWVGRAGVSRIESVVRDCPKRKNKRSASVKND